MLGLLRDAILHYREQALLFTGKVDYKWQELGVTFMQPSGDVYKGCRFVAIMMTCVIEELCEAGFGMQRMHKGGECHTFVSDRRKIGIN